MKQETLEVVETIRITPEERELVRQIARAQDRSRSYVIRRALREWLARYKKNAA